MHYPTPVWTPFAWLLQARTDVVEIQNGLRSTLFRRMSSLMSSAINGLAIVCIALYRHPTPPFLIWGIIDTVLVAIRLMIVIAVLRLLRSGGREGRARLVDAFMGSSLLWYFQIGVGAFLCLASGDLVLGIFSALLSMGTVGATCARNPGAPRMTAIQIGLITVPLALGALLSPTALIHLVALMAPIYLLGCTSINWQLHEDHLSMLMAEHKLRHLALHCGLTGLPNRSHFYESLSTALLDCSQHPVSVLCLDLDGFKAVNDRHGHLAGDMLLQQVAERLNRCRSSQSVAARLGGDEFAVMTRRQSQKEVRGMASLLLAEISLPYELPEGIVVTIGVSIGLSTYRDDVVDPVALLVQADRALYVAKRAGKGVCRSYDAVHEATYASGRGTW